MCQLICKFAADLEISKLILLRYARESGEMPELFLQL